MNAWVPQRWHPAIHDTCVAAPDIITYTLKQYSNSRGKHSHVKPFMLHLIHTEFTRDMVGFFTNSVWEHDPESKVRFQTRDRWQKARRREAMADPMVVRAPCELCGKPVPMRSQDGFHARCLECGLLHVVAHEDNAWRFACSELSTTLVPNLEECYSTLGIPHGTSLTSAKEAFA